MTHHVRLAIATCACIGATVRAHAQSAALPEWRFDPTPVLTLGGGTNPQTEFLRIGGAWRLANGSVAVLNRGSNEIRVFDARGTFLSAIGRKGQGPGEFESIGWAGRAGDTAFVFDVSNNRITTIALAETPRVISTVNVTASGGRSRFGVTGRLSDGRWVVTTSFGPSFDGPPGVHRLQMSTGLIPASATGTVEWIEAEPSGAIFVHNPTGDMKQAIVGLTAFTPWFYAVGSGASVWYGESGSDSIMTRDAASARRRVALPFAAMAPTPKLVTAAREAELMPDNSERARSFTDVKYGALLPKQLPRFGGILPVSDGGVWVSSYPGDRAEPTRHLVINSQGAPIAFVTAPRGVRITEAGPDYIVGIYADDDGVESVRVYRLRRG